MWVIGGLFSFVNSNKIRSRLDIGKTFKNEIIAQKKEVLNISRFEGTGLSFVAIDFETANNNRDSACQMGIVVIENGIITEEKSWLIKPQPNTFLARFTDIHGIDKYDVENSPRFKDIWAVIEPYISGRLLIAHNMRFDESVLNACLLKYGLTVPKYKTLDTLALSRICFNTANYKLPTLCDELGIELNHHDALSDARAAAILFMCCCEKLETFDLEALDNVIYSNNLTHSVDAVAYISFAKKKAVSYNEVVQIMEKQTDYNFIDEVHSASFHLSKDALKLKRLLTATTSWKKEIIMEGINLKHSQLTKIIWLLQSPNPNREDFILADESIEFKNLLSTLKKRNSLIIK